MSTPDTTAAGTQGTYTIVSASQINRWDQQLQTAVEGWQLDVRWNRTGHILRVFVPLDQYNVTNVDTMIRQAGALDDEVSALGK